MMSLTKLEMLPLALRDLVSLCSMPFVVNSHGKDFIRKNLAQSIGIYQICENDMMVGKRAFRGWEVVECRGLLCQCRQELYRSKVVTNRVSQQKQKERLCNGGFFKRHR